MIDGSKITAVGSLAELPMLDTQTMVLDLSDKYVLPGLINSHAHLCLPADGKPPDDHNRESNEIWLLTAARNARIALMSGVTTVRDCGGRDGVTFGLRRAIEMGLTEGPRLFLSGRALTMTGGHAFRSSVEVDGVDEITRVVRQLFKEGADFIKLMATGGGTPGSYPDRASFSVQEIRAAVETARRIGKTVTAHCRGIPGMKNVIEAGIDHMEHACFELPGFVLKFDPRIAEQIARAGMYVTPTIQLYRDNLESLTRKKEEGVITPAQERKLAYLPRSVDEKLRSLRGLLDAGVKCVAGNDAGLAFTGFGHLWQELDAMVEGGMTPMEAIVSATRTAAEAMGRDTEIGSIKVGNEADIIAVDNDPTADISALSSVSFVMKAGEICLRP
jgi:imidazolonepropionase-like amidohydrolase